MEERSRCLLLGELAAGGKISNLSPAPRRDVQPETGFRDLKSFARYARCHDSACTGVLELTEKKNTRCVPVHFVESSGIGAVVVQSPGICLGRGRSESRDWSCNFLF